MTPLPRPIRKPVNRKMSVVVEPTEPMAAELEKRPTTARSTMLKSICKRLVNIRGSEKPMIWRPRLPCVISSVAERAIKYPSLSLILYSESYPYSILFPALQAGRVRRAKNNEKQRKFFQKSRKLRAKTLAFRSFV